jgi:hypothetical protein
MKTPPPLLQAVHTYLQDLVNGDTPSAGAELTGKISNGLFSDGFYKIPISLFRLPNNKTVRIMEWGLMNLDSFDMVLEVKRYRKIGEDFPPIDFAGL